LNGSVTRQRLFLALWPDEAVRDRIATLATTLRVRGGRPVPPENWHITLAFLGGVDAKTRLSVERAAGTVRVPAFDLSLDRLGFWARPGGVLWLGASDPPAALLALAAEVLDRASGSGVAPDRRAFHPHLTLMRRVERAAHLDPPAPIRWPIAGFVLCESATEPRGARYRVLRRWPLRA
jgi:2'-5' RNA ligase